MDFIREMYTTIGGSYGLIILILFLLSLLWMPRMSNDGNDWRREP